MLMNHQVNTKLIRVVSYLQYYNLLCGIKNWMKVARTKNKISYMYKSMLIIVIYNLRLQNILIYSFHLGPVNSSPEKFKNVATCLKLIFES